MEGEGWTAAGDLNAGDELEEPDGSYATVVSSVAQADAGGVAVYNFTVDNDHTYFVDESGDAVWVHNECVYREVVNGVVKYVGITKNFVSRARNHARIGRIVEEVIGLTNLTRMEARVAEDLLIKKYGRAIDTITGTLANINRGIDPAKMAKYNQIIPKMTQLLTDLGLL